MFKRGPEGVSVPVSLRMTDGALLIGSINCGGTGKLENFLGSDVKFVEFVSKEGQQRFIAHHQIASVEPLASLDMPTLETVVDDVEPFGVFGLEHRAAWKRLWRLFKPCWELIVLSAGRGLEFHLNSVASRLKSRARSMRLSPLSKVPFK